MLEIIRSQNFQIIWLNLKPQTDILYTALCHINSYFTNNKYIYRPIKYSKAQL